MMIRDVIRKSESGPGQGCVALILYRKKKIALVYGMTAEGCLVVDSICFSYLYDEEKF